MVFWRKLLRLLGRLGQFLIKISEYTVAGPLPGPPLLPVASPAPHRSVEPHSEYLFVLRDGQRLMIHYGLETPIEWTVGTKKDLSKTTDRVEEGSYWMEWRLLSKEHSWPSEWKS